MKKKSLLFLMAGAVAMAVCSCSQEDMLEPAEDTLSAITRAKENPPNDPPPFDPTTPGGEGGGGGGSGSGNPLSGFSVPNNHCALGTLAAAIIMETGVSMADALRMASNAWAAAGVDFRRVPVLGPGGVSTSIGQINQALAAAGFNVNSIHPRGYSSHFSNGGYGIGLYDGSNGAPGHMTLVTGYDPGTGTVTYYDSVEGKTNTVSGGLLDKLIPFN